MKKWIEKSLYSVRGVSLNCFLLLISGLLLINPIPSTAQEYGLGFWGSDTVKDKRTKLDLYPEKYFVFHDEFEISFEMQLRPSQRLHFGYIARIADPDGKNIDIFYNGPESMSLQVIYGQKLTRVNIPNAFPGIEGDWTEIRLKIDLKNQSLQFSLPDTTIIDNDISFKGRAKILIGANDFVPFKSSDVPAMNIRDIKIYERGKLKHHFPLEETTGNSTQDVRAGLMGSVMNPIWIKSPYLNWQKIFTGSVKGFASITWDPGEEKIYMVGEEKVRVLSIPDNKKTSYDAEFRALEPGSQLIFDTIRDALFCYNLRSKTVHEFNQDARQWNMISEGNSNLAALWFHNKYYSPADSSLYIFGGYGQHRYFRTLQHFDFRTLEWDTLQTSGDPFHPRMHAASGEFNDTIYILGGFGSVAGEQALKPQHYKDLMAFDLKEHRFLKKFEYEAPMEGIDFAHSMVIDKSNRSYYVLASTIFEYESNLQLLRGNLDKPGLKLTGRKIPYLYHNENAWSDLFFSESSGKLIAVTFLAKPNLDVTEINIYTISFPPHLIEEETIPAESTYLNIIVIIAVGLIAIILILLLLGLYRRKNNKPEEQEVPLLSIPGDNGNKPVNSILFFGGFQIINRDGEDITSKFTQLLKELFLVIFLNSIKNKGISLQRLTEIFWFGMDEKSAKNNRAVNIAKLKNLLTELDGCQLSRKTGYWQIIFNDTLVYNDYWTSKKMINQNNDLSRNQFDQFLSITRMGPLLPSAEYEWLDEFKSECSNDIIDTLMRYSDSVLIETDCELIIRLSDNILIFDMLHEEAIGMKCKALISLGKHSLAKTTFTKFANDYQKLYDEPYKKSFNELIKS